MTPETLKRLEELNDEWANETQPPHLECWISSEVMGHLPDLIAAVKERDAWRAEFPEREPKHVSYELAVVSAELKAAQADHDAAQKALQKIRCIYCGFECSSDDAHKLADHILHCDKSPLVQLNKDIQSRATDLIDMTRDEFIRICALTDDTEIHGICTRSQEMIDQKYPVIKQRDDAIKERDAALKACAEMGDVLVEIQGKERWSCDVTTGVLGHEKDGPWVCINHDVLDHALSTDCGKGYIKAESLKCFKCDDGHTPLYCLNCARDGYHHDRDCEPLVEALKRVVEHKEDDPKNSNGLSAGEISVGDLRACLKALAHWEKGRKGQP